MAKEVMRLTMSVAFGPEHLGPGRVSAAHQLCAPGESAQSLSALVRLSLS